MKAQERSQIQEIDRETIVSHIHKILSGSLVPGLFPEQLVLWESIQDTVELRCFIHSAIDKFTSLFKRSSKGRRSKLTYTLLGWITFVVLYISQNNTCHPDYDLSISFHTQRTVTTRILHAVQDGTNGC